MIFFIALGGAIAWAALQTRSGMALDALSRYAVAEGQELFFGLDFYILSVASVPVLVAVMVIAALIAAVRRRWALAGRAIVLVAGANLTTQVLKYYVLQRASLGVDYATQNSLPSGHTTAAISAAIALLMVVPHAWRNCATWVGWLLTVMMGLAVMANHWHRLADVLVAICVGAAWGFALAPLEKRQSAGRGSWGMSLLTVVAAVGTVGGAITVAWAYWGLPDQNLDGSSLQILAGTQLGQALALASVLLICSLSALTLRGINAQAR